MEYSLIEKEKEAAKKQAFYSKVKDVTSKLPMIAQVWEKLDMDQLDNKMNMKAIKHDLTSIKDKDTINFNMKEVGNYDVNPQVVPVSELDKL